MRLSAFALLPLLAVACSAEVPRTDSQDLCAREVVTVLVVDEQQQRLAGVDFLFAGRTPDLQTDALGRVDFPRDGAPWPFGCWVLLRKKGYAPQLREVANLAVIEMKRQTSLVVQVLDVDGMPLPGVRVSPSRKLSGSPSAPTELKELATEGFVVAQFTDADGRAVFPVRPMSDLILELESGRTLDSPHSEGRFHSPVNGAADVNFMQVQLQEEPPSTLLRGRVLLPDGTPAPLASVSIDRDGPSTRTDLDGRFSLAVIDGSESRLQVRVNPSAPGGPIGGSSTPWELSIPNDLAEPIDFRLSAGRLTYQSEDWNPAALRFSFFAPGVIDLRRSESGSVNGVFTDLMATTGTYVFYRGSDVEQMVALVVRERETQVVDFSGFQPDLNLTVRAETGLMFNGAIIFTGDRTGESHVIGRVGLGVENEARYAMRFFGESGTLSFVPRRDDLESVSTRYRTGSKPVELVLSARIEANTLQFFFDD